ncbi:LOW QUALITY PROTEIN: uncharacterized protein [Blastocystis hominis]|uniref:Rab-GAP TBC domain-containing protein n=1 Tax=Blastocystis hominis TaxID=12968 RepID=D8M9G2_BLAHO|nr:LOW QUALITY PROTEIN: uncharacterized protein [Blastocystis hominis]CBK24701.2 unnamed protein product [Blastocystis hominis]|eukprot:XP_012898749.1 LOW QUALITY PROTEIN: uncharacterized protein [Blastocystis hominis]
MSGFQAWLEQRRKKKRENENMEFLRSVIPAWQYKREGNLAKKVCYEGMIPYTRIKSWNVMIGTEVRIAAKLYRVNVKNGKGLREKFTSNPDAPTEGNEKSILQIPQAVKDVYPEESSFHDARFERDLQELLETFVAYRPDIGYFDGLNYISAMLLQFQDEESAFTSTVNLFTQYLSNAVDPEMKDKFKEYCAAFGSAMDEEVPDVRSAFQDNKVDIAVILKDWIYSLFTRCVNFEDAKRLWDILLLEGSFGIVKIALGILKMFAGELCDMRSKEVYAFLKHLPAKLDIDELAKGGSGV